MVDDRPNRAKPECTVDNFNVSLQHLILLTNVDGMRTMHKLVLQGNPFKDLGSVASTISTMVGLTSQHQQAACPHFTRTSSHHKKSLSLRDVASNAVYVDAQVQVHHLWRNK